jgi:hypothetical protein
VRNDVHVWTAAAYIARNPVVAGLCDKADEWRWSSHHAIVDGTAVPWLDHERLLSYYDALGGEPQRRYLDAVALS